MNKKRIIAIVIILIIIVAIFMLGLNILESFKLEEDFTEYTPREEITEEQLRYTIISLYYINKETNNLMPEARSIDVKMLVDNPYKTLIDMIIAAPKSDKLKTAMPEGTKVNSAQLKGNTIYLDLSKEFIENHKGGKDEEINTIYAIVNTLTELNEADNVKILIDGEENKGFKDNNINFENSFMRQD